MAERTDGNIPKEAKFHNIQEATLYSLELVLRETETTPGCSPFTLLYKRALNNACDEIKNGNYSPARELVWNIFRAHENHCSGARMHHGLLYPNRTYPPNTPIENELKFWGRMSYLLMRHKISEADNNERNTRQFNMVFIQSVLNADLNAPTETILEDMRALADNF